MLTGPTGPGSFPPGAVVTCDYLDKKMSGTSPKFTCVVPPDDELKVKYGRDNGEVFAEVASSRLLWALGFGADHLYPVSVVCHGCPSKITGTEFASIQRKMPGKEIEAGEHTGWAWPELDLMDSEAATAERPERDALKLLAVLLQHTDSKPEQQRLLCVDAEKGKGAPCTKTFMMVHDLGLTFGRANYLNRNRVASVNFPEWSRTPVWKDSTGCTANMAKSRRGTLDNPVISEAGRRFLADLLARLSDTQLTDLFTASRIANRSGSTATVQQWVDAFKQKRNEIVTRTCPS